MGWVVSCGSWTNTSSWLIELACCSTVCHSTPHSVPQHTPGARASPLTSASRLYAALISPGVAAGLTPSTA